MILTVTLNSALDKIIFIEEFIPGSVHRTEKVNFSVGGKGLDSSVALRCLGVDTVGLVFVAGETGRKLIDLVDNYGIISEPIWVGGETRVAHVISENKFGRHTHIISGKITIGQEEMEEFISRFSFHLNKANYVICAGSIPQGINPRIYYQLVRISNQYKKPVLIDSSGQAIIESLPAKPEIVKMNRAEFEKTFDCKANTLDDLKVYAFEIFKEYKIQSLVVTCSKEGILSFTSNGGFHTIVPRLKAVNAAGAGDAVSSALAWRFSECDNWFQALSWAGAVSAAVVLTPGTAECKVEDVQTLLPEILIEEIQPS
jgi:1-phosphofructokinase family hexose kinase